MLLLRMRRVARRLRGRLLVVKLVGAFAVMRRPFVILRARMFRVALRFGAMHGGFRRFLVRMEMRGRHRAIGVAGVARRLRVLGRRGTAIVRFADDVAETLDAFLGQRLRARAQELLARARRPRPARRFGRSRLVADRSRRCWLAPPHFASSAIPGRRIKALAPRRRRWWWRGRARIAQFRSRLARRLRLDLADRVFQRQTFPGDFRFRERRLYGA